MKTNTNDQFAHASIKEKKDSGWLSSNEILQKIERYKTWPVYTSR